MDSRKKPFFEQMQGEESFTLPILVDCRESACGLPGALLMAGAGRATTVKT